MLPNTVHNIHTLIVAVSEKSTETLEKSTLLEKTRREQSASLEYGRASTSKAVRRAEIHAMNSGKDPRHVPLPRSVDDDISKLVGLEGAGC